MSKVIIFGAGKIADEAFFYFTNDSPHEIVAFTVDSEYLIAPEKHGLPVIPFEEIREKYPPGDHKMFVAVGYQDLNRFRAQKYAEAKAKNYELVSYISSRAANVGKVEVGDNCFVLEFATIQPCASVGNDVFIWSGNHIGHSTVINDHVMITSHVVISGCCTVGEFSFLGVNATVRDETVIARESLIGMGVSILKDTKEFEVYKAKGAEPAGFRSDEIKSLSHKSKG